MTPILPGQSVAIDAAALAAVSRGDPGIEADLAHEFARSGPAMIAHCRLMLEANDNFGVEHWAHTLKGSGQIFGAATLVGHCQQMESLGRQSALDRAAPVLQALELEWVRVQKQLAHLCERERVG